MLRAHSKSLRLVLTVSGIFQFFYLAWAQSTCSDTQDCAQGCCSTSGYCGFGPSFCGDGNCTSSCDAIAECGPYAAADSFDCPLNVCCSQYGYCGTTSDFCGTGCVAGCDDVVEPSCSGSSSDKRTIGYYESWSYTRTCDSWSPNNINARLWTHLNYGFALIGDDYTISQMNNFDAELYPLFTGLKEQNGALKTFISVGGWAAGGKIFSDMVSTATNRAVFINSALQFMRTYGFDGIDIDWEYPAASDRDGVAADTANFVSFLQELKVVFGSNYGISVTLPSSYWYLQGFDVVSMEPYVDWFNFMSYDIHGTWDGNSPYTQAIVQPHTNLTEITEGLDLLWRNNIKPSKVVLGLAFYGRSFTLSDSSCNTPGCAFSGGGTAGPCTGTSGILSNAEIQDVISKYDLTPTLDKDAAVKYMTWDSDQWVSYDDEETLALKKDYANSHCLGGTMVWALDLDDPSTSTSVSNLQSTGLKLTGDDVDSNPTFALSKLSAITQQNNIGLVSYWTDCSSDPQCAAGFSLVTTGHGKIFDADTMAYTGDGCHGGGKGYNRALCVESDVQLKDCSWFGKPKDCKQTCPSGYALIGQNTHIGGASTSCKAGHFSSYCCGSITTSGVQECESDIISPFSNGIGITIRQSESSVVEKYQGTSADDALVGTSEECDYLLSGLAVMIGSPNYILNEIPGSWQTYRGLGVAAWSPVMNSNYPTASSVTCTTTTTDTTTTFTTTSSAKHVTCDGNRYGQACGHYSSVVVNNPSNRELVCPYDLWGDKKTYSVKSYEDSHVKAWLLWVPNLPAGTWPFNKCARDEYPPKHFLDSTQTNYNQWIRFLPFSENSGAGNLWKNICGNPSSSSTVQGGSINALTCYETMSVTVTLNKMSMHFTNLASDNLGINPCLPEITDDSGFALLTNDVWYGGNANNHHDSTAYKSAIPSSLTAGRTAPRTSPAKRDVQLQMLGQILQEASAHGDLFVPDDTEDFSPDKVLMNDGDMSRKATSRELWERLGIIDCESAGCLEEAAAMGIAYEDGDDEPSVAQPPPAIPTRDRPATPTATKAVSGSKPTAVAKVTGV